MERRGRYLRFQDIQHTTDTDKKVYCRFVNGETWVGFGAEEFKERKSLLKS